MTRPYLYFTYSCITCPSLFWNMQSLAQSPAPLCPHSEILRLSHTPSLQCLSTVTPGGLIDSSFYATVVGVLFSTSYINITLCRVFYVFHV